MISQNNLEERSLFWSESGVLSRDEDVDGSHGASLGGRWLLVAEQLVADFHQIGFGEDETNVIHDVGQNLGMIVREIGMGLPMLRFEA